MIEVYFQGGQPKGSTLDEGKSIINLGQSTLCYHLYLMHMFSLLLPSITAGKSMNSLFGYQWDIVVLLCYNCSCLDVQN